MNSPRRIAPVFLVLAASIALGACGGAGSGSSSVVGPDGKKIAGSGSPLSYPAAARKAFLAEQATLRSLDTGDVEESAPVAAEAFEKLAASLEALDAPGELDKAHEQAIDALHSNARVVQGNDQAAIQVAFSGFTPAWNKVLAAYKAAGHQDIFAPPKLDAPSASPTIPVPQDTRGFANGSL